MIIPRIPVNSPHDPYHSYFTLHLAPVKSPKVGVKVVGGGSRSSDPWDRYVRGSRAQDRQGSVI